MTIITESQWVNYFGFQRFPFDRPEAGNEEFARPDFLASCFVEPKGFERVFGQADSPPVTSFLFASRGTGKTSCRVMMDYYCQNGLARLSSPRQDEQNYVLSIPHTRLDNVLDLARQSSQSKNPPEILAEHHIVEIMMQAIPVFVDLIAKNPPLAKRVRNLPRADFEDLCFYLVHYSTYLTSSQKYFLGDLNVDPPPFHNPMKGLVGQDIPYNRAQAWEASLYQKRLLASPMHHLERWARLMPSIGIKATYVLVDGVDEIMESAGDPNYAHYLIRPLFTHLRLMDGLNHFALKFFLPTDIERLVVSDPAFRRDRGFVIERLIWQPGDLVRILRERLNALREPDYEIRDRTAAGFDALCVPELRGEIEQNIINVIKGNPRQLMNFCALMVSVHCNREINGQDDPYQLSRQDFEAALQVFDVKPAVQTEGSENGPLDIMSLIGQGENESLEFKSSLRYDYKKQSVNRDELGLVVAKTVAGFMNRSGGILLLGVDDDGQLLGIEKDIESLPKKNTDGFQLAFKEIIKTYIGLEYLICTHLEFEDITDHKICVVMVEKSPTPVFVKIGNNEEFYVRMLNSTNKLSLPETVNYIRSRWDKF